MQALSTNLEKLACFSHAAKHQTPLPGDHAEFACERAWLMRGDHPFSGEVRLYNLHASGKQDKERHTGIAGAKQDLPAVDLSHFAAGPSAINLRSGQYWKGLGISVERTELGIGGHSFSNW